LRLAVTGSSGLIGRTLVTQLRDLGYQVIEVDITENAALDITRPEAIKEALSGCNGVIHLAAVSRVAEAQKHPKRTWSVNVDGTCNVIRTLLEQEHRPWLLHASSREVYGDQPAIRINEDTPITPLNVYGRSKAACESIIWCARDAGLNTGILRFANVYGDIFDYPDRVIPAFSNAAATGTALRVDDSGTCMDFTHVSDVCRGIVTMVDMLNNQETNLPPIHLATGHGTTLGTLAEMAVTASSGRCKVNEGTRRSSSVGCFIGNPDRAYELLGWKHETDLGVGFNKMVAAFKDKLN
jgi:nucleoside-diphosphate-sugar epimerase